MAIDIPTSDIEQRMRTENKRKETEQNDNVGRREQGKKWSPAEARRVLETKLQLLGAAKDGEDILKLKSDILFDVRKQLEKCAAAEITRRKEIYDHIKFLEDIAGADIEDIYTKMEPKHITQLEKIKDFVEEERGDTKRIEAKRAQIVKKQNQTWAGMKGAAVKGQRAEARAEAAQLSPTRKTQEAAMAREAKNIRALVEADVYEEQTKPQSKFGKFFRKLFGVKTVAEDEADRAQAGEEMEARMLKKAEKQDNAPVVGKKPFFAKAKEFISPASYNVYIEGAGAVPRAELKNNLELVKRIQKDVDNEFIRQFEILPELKGLPEKELQALWKSDVEKNGLPESVTAKLLENSSTISVQAIAKEVSGTLSKRVREFKAVQKGERILATEAVRKSTAEARREGRTTRDELKEEGLDQGRYDYSDDFRVSGMSKERATRIQQDLVDDAFKDVDKNRYFSKNFDKALTKLKITNPEVIGALKAEILKVLGKEALSTLKMNEIRAEQIKTKLNTVLKKYDEGKLEGKLLELLKKAA